VTLTPEKLSPTTAWGQAAREEQDLRELAMTWSRPPGFWGWLVSTNHKDIAIRYIITAMIFFAMAGILALLMRVQLAVPQNSFLSNDRYNQFFTVHGSAMMFLFAVPIMEAMGMYMVPLMVGTRNVSFPRMNALGYWIFLAGGILLFGGLFFNVGADRGWFSYTPLSGPEYAPGHRSDFWNQMITLTEVAALISAVEIIATVFKQRAPGMALNRIPLFVWAMLITAFMVLFAMPSVMLVSSMLAMDRLPKVTTHFFNAAEGGSNLLYQHLFWFFGHPEVYIIFIPATGFVSTILPTFCRRKIFGYTAIILSLIATAFIGFGLWVHHMFATPVPNLGQAFFTGSSEMIAIPSGIQIFCWIATIWAGRPKLATPMLFCLGFIALFVMGGLTGVMLAAVSLDLQVHDTYFVVAHFHYVLIGGSVFPLFGAFYYWFPKWTGKMLSETMGKINFWTLFVGFNLTFFPMHILGLHGMTRRVYTYGKDTGWGTLNLFATIGAFIIALAVVLFVANVLYSLFRGRAAGKNPWNAPTLEWATDSPAPDYNFAYPPTVRSLYPIWEDPPNTPVVSGLSTDRREVLITTTFDAIPHHRYSIAPSSILPLLYGVAISSSIIACIFTPWGLPVGLVVSGILLTIWFYHSSYPHSHKVTPPMD
jgi:cytochrome c oxidase subunit 1